MDGTCDLGEFLGGFLLLNLFFSHCGLSCAGSFSTDTRAPPWKTRAYGLSAGASGRRFLEPPALSFQIFTSIAFLFPVRQRGRDDLEGSRQDADGVFFLAAPPFGSPAELHLALGRIF